MLFIEEMYNIQKYVNAKSEKLLHANANREERAILKT